MYTLCVINIVILFRVCLVGEMEKWRLENGEGIEMWEDGKIFSFP